MANYAYHRVICKKETAERLFLDKEAYDTPYPYITFYEDD